jgi:uncharacterized protein (DUF427 family)
MVLSTAYEKNPGHKITVQPYKGRVVVTFKGTLVADTVRALELKEASYPATFYIPRDDCKMVHFVETDHKTTCPFKGKARYWTLSSKDGEAPNAVWGYDNPFDQVAEIDGHVAFYPNKVEITSGAG